MSFSFSTPSSAPATGGLSSGLSFGANKPATPGFGLTATSQPSTLFGNTPATSAPAFGTTTPAFGTAAPFSTAAPSFGAATSAPPFGATNTATPAFGATSTAPTLGTGLGGGLGTGLSFGTGTSAPSTGLTFGAPAATTASTGIGGGLGGFGFGAPASTAQTSGLGLFNTSTTAAGSTGLFGAKLGTTGAATTQQTTTVTPSLGLGGISTLSGPGATNTAPGDGKTEPPKQTKLPNEISTNVENFKEFVKKQKSLSSDIMRVSIKPLHKVSIEADELIRSVATLSGELHKSRAQCKKLRHSGAQALMAAETCACEAPNGSILEGSSPPELVRQLVSDLEQQLLTFRRQLDAADKQLQAAPTMLSEQELTLGIRRIHESLIALASRLQAVHTQVEAQKEQYLNLRKYVLKDPTNVFETQNTASNLEQILREAENQRKKSRMSLGDSKPGAFLADRIGTSTVHQLAGPTPFSYIENTSPYTAPETSAPTFPTPTPFFASATPAQTTSRPFAAGKRGKQ